MRVLWTVKQWSESQTCYYSISCRWFSVHFCLVEGDLCEPWNWCVIASLRSDCLSRSRMVRKSPHGLAFIIGVLCRIWILLLAAHTHTHSPLCYLWSFAMFPFSPRDSPPSMLNLSSLSLTLAHLRALSLSRLVILNGFHMELWSGLVSHVTADTSSLPLWRMKHFISGWEFGLHDFVWFIDYWVSCLTIGCSMASSVNPTEGGSGDGGVAVVWSEHC